ncbi:MAG TPA: hypothetical protein VET23_10075 [Chitinophagaceae bacterium]|nr:hypothetical protein [Chitinophagaceae bacterium]
MIGCIHTNYSLLISLLPSILAVILIWVAFLYKRKEIKFGRLHEERILVLKEIYKLIIRLNIHFTEYVKPNNVFADTQYNYRGLANAYNSFLKEYLENKVFLPNDLIFEIEKLKNYCTPLIDIYFFYEQYVKSGGERGKQPDDNKMNQIEEKLKIDLPVILENIEEKFKKIFK